MSLGLDLSASEAKLARARVHLDALKREIQLVLKQSHPYTSSIVKIDPDSEWYSVRFMSHDMTEPGLGVIFGDVVHNLRCALDYIVTQLVEKSKTPLTGNHEFPIFTDQQRYTKQVGTAMAAEKGGKLGGVIYGLQEIWDLQPFHRKPNPAIESFSGGDIAEAHVLFHIKRFSNADKHRLFAKPLPLIDRGGQLMFYHDAAVLEYETPKLPDWEANIEFEIARVRLAKPTNVRLDANIALRVCFGTSAFAQHTSGHGIDTGVLDEACKHVAMITDLFKAL
jgi:hypothetical protein